MAADPGAPPRAGPQGLFLHPVTVRIVQKSLAKFAFIKYSYGIRQ